jgi:hypothetical protein
MDDLAVILSIIGGTIGIVGALIAAWKVTAAQHRRREQTKKLRVTTGRLLRIDNWIANAVVSIDGGFWEGPGWTGLSILPPLLNGPITQLRGIQLELRQTRSELRALDAAGHNEKVREDLERMTAILDEVTSAYIAGATGSYQIHNGEALEPSPAARETTPALEPDTAGHVLALRDEFTLLARTAMRRSGGDNQAERYHACWPVARHDCEYVPPSDLSVPDGSNRWRHEP